MFSSSIRTSFFKLVSFRARVEFEFEFELEFSSLSQAQLNSRLTRIISTPTLMFSLMVLLPLLNIRISFKSFL